MSRVAEIQRKTPCRIDLDVPRPIGETHFWVFTGSEPRVGQECACGLATWPWRAELPWIDLRKASA